MDFATPNTEISIKKMKRMTKFELAQEIFRRDPPEFRFKFIAGVPYDTYFSKNVLIDILNHIILSNKRSE